MSNADLDPSLVAHSTLRLLETRLRRLEFLLTGTFSATPANVESSDTPVPKPLKHDVTVNGRIQKLQADLNSLRSLRGSAGDIVRDVEGLHSKAPDIFVPSSLPAPSTISDLSTTSAIVLAHATLFPESASRLSSLQSLQIPSAEQSDKLISLRTRIESALQKQSDLSLEAEDLRYRSAKCLEWWVKYGVVGMGEMWEDWESRVHQVDRDVKRLERRQAEDEGFV